ncbi:hypothetical protein TNCV_3644681 [Trichonephila clavipes]|nr:hypothetical protein TNCV_3644681 [Trichonephila clavipes]
MRNRRQGWRYLAAATLPLSCAADINTRPRRRLRLLTYAELQFPFLITRTLCIGNPGRAYTPLLLAFNLSQEGKKASDRYYAHRGRCCSPHCPLALFNLAASDD